MNAISPDLLADLEGRLTDAIERVSEGAATAGVSLAFSVKRDKEGCIVTKYALKGGHARQGEWYPPEQAPLPFDATAPDAEADAEAEAWRPSGGLAPEDPDPRFGSTTEAAVGLAAALNVRRGGGPGADAQGTAFNPYTPPLYRRLGQVMRHRLPVSEAGEVGEVALCGCASGQGPYSAVPPDSGSECRDCARLVGELPWVSR